jgi:dolichol-phosphate mannosyltransferase
MAVDAFVSVVVPLHNDAHHLPASIAELMGVLESRYTHFEVILVDDWSSDATLTVLDGLLRQYPCLRAIRLSRRFGWDGAVAAGLDCSIGDLVVVMKLGDDSASLIPSLVERARHGFDIVVGRTAPPPYRTRWRNGLAGLLRSAYEFDDPARAATLLLFSRPAANAVTRMMQRRRRLAAVAHGIGFSLTYHDYQRVTHTLPPRSLRATVSAAMSDMVLNSTRPLRIVTACGIIAGLFNLLYVGYVLAVALLKNHVAEGWTTLSLQISSMFFMVFVILAVLAEYLGKTLDEAKGEPTYHVLDVKDSPRSTARPDRLNVLDRDAA